jgi:hypothetical protein
VAQWDETGEVEDLTSTPVLENGEEQGPDRSRVSTPGLGNREEQGLNS